MKVIKYTFMNFGSFPVRLGRVGDSHATRIEVDVTGIMTERAHYKIVLRHPDSLDTRSVTPTLAGSILTYDVTPEDVPVVGYGRMQIIAEGADGTTIKSAVALTKIAPSLPVSSLEPQTSEAVLQQARELLRQMQDIAEETAELRPLIVDNTGRLYVGSNAVAFLADFEDRIAALEQQMPQKADVEWIRKLLMSVFLLPDGTVIFDTESGVFDVQDGTVTVDMDGEIVYLNENKELEVITYGQDSAG